MSNEASAVRRSLQIEINPYFNKDQTVKEYEAWLDTVMCLALFSAALFSLNWFLGVCSLTWESVIILGGLLPLLGAEDFYFISVVLVFEALCLATATSFGNLSAGGLIYRNTHPARTKHYGKDQHRFLAFGRVLDPTIQLIVLGVCIFPALKRLPRLPQQPADAELHFDGLHHSLRIFYNLVVINASTAVFGVLFSKIVVVPCFTTTFSLRCYYDHVVWRGMEKGFLHSTDFNFFAFAFKALADEYRRNLRAPGVYERYGDCIRYLYAHNHGFDAARIAMDSQDHCEQVAAASIVGLWAQLEGAGSSLLLQSRLLTKLADARDHQETGSAATCSFESLAKLSEAEISQLLLEVENGRGERLMTILCKCISKAVKVKKENKALVFMKVLIQLLRSEAGRQERKEKCEGVVQDLKIYCCSSDLHAGRGRYIGVAWKALKEMNVSLEASVEEKVKTVLLSSLPTERDQHILEDEKEYMVELLGQERPPLGWTSIINPHGDTWSHAGGLG